MTRSSRTPRHLAAVVSAFALIALAGCGAGDTDPAQVAPAATPMFAEVVVDPHGGQETAVQALLAKFPGGGTTASGGLVSSLIEDGLRMTGAPIDYATDIQPWLGERAAVYITGLKADSSDGEPDLAVALASDDAAASQAALDKLFPGGKAVTHDGVSYKVGPPGEESLAVGMVGNFVVIGTPAAFTATVDASKGDSLGDAQAYQDAIGKLPAERLAGFFIDPSRILNLTTQATGASGPEVAAQQAALADAGPVAGAVTADANGFVVDSATKAVAGMTVPPGSGALVGDLPADSGIAAGIPALGTSLKTSLEQAAGSSGMDPDTLNLLVKSQTGLDALSLLDWLGNTGIFVAGTSVKDLGAGVVIQSNDPAASEDTINSLKAFLGKADGISIGKPLVDGDAGFSIEAKDLPEPIVVEQTGEKVVIAYGRTGAETATDSSDVLADNPDYTAAAGRLGEGFEPSLYVALDSILEFASTSFGLDKDPVFSGIQAYLEPFADVVAGGKMDGDQILTRMRLDIE
jgi:hypothetical protein